MHIPLLLLLWFTVAAYVVHCIDESPLGSFVEKGDSTGGRNIPGRSSSGSMPHISWSSSQASSRTTFGEAGG
jgi:hypothetical protein